VWSVHDDTLGSDHHPITTTIRFKACAVKRRPSKRFIYRKADWPKFREVLDENLKNSSPKTSSLNDRCSWFEECITKAAKVAAPYGSSGTQRPWFNKECADAIAARNRAAKAVRKHQGDPMRVHNWREACRRVKALVRDANRKSWRDFVSQMDARTSTTAVWRVIRNIDGRQGETKEGAALHDKDRVLSSSQDKADAFVKEYASVSCIRNKKEDRPFIKKVREMYSKKCPNDHHDVKNRSICSPFSDRELQNALNAVRLRSQPGDDGIANYMLRQLSESGKQTLLGIYNQSREERTFPSCWKKATIIPILKRGKDPQLLGSFRPICLTSCLGKTIERLFKNCLVYFLEQEGKFCHSQARFRSMRSTQDQVMLMTQRITDGFNDKKSPKRTVLALIDFSRAFDTVWHPGLLYKIVKMGIPICICQWLRSFLQDRAVRECQQQVSTVPLRHSAGLGHFAASLPPIH
jgi:hypothetical protein